MDFECLSILNADTIYVCLKEPKKGGRRETWIKRGGEKKTKRGNI